MSNLGLSYKIHFFMQLYTLLQNISAVLLIWTISYTCPKGDEDAKERIRQALQELEGVQNGPSNPEDGAGNTESPPTEHQKGGSEHNDENGTEDEKRDTSRTTASSKKPSENNDAAEGSNGNENASEEYSSAKEKSQDNENNITIDHNDLTADQNHSGRRSGNGEGQENYSEKSVSPKQGHGVEHPRN